MIRLTTKQAGRLGIGAKRSKYRAQPTTVDGIRFASKKEANRYVELRAAELAGRIRCLELQPTYKLECSTGKEVCRYRADFRYLDKATGLTVVEDVKGMLTPLYKLKRKWMKLQHGITITEV